MANAGDKGKKLYVRRVRRSLNRGMDHAAMVRHICQSSTELKSSTVARETAE